MDGEGGRIGSQLVVGIGGTMREGSTSLAALRRAVAAAARAGARTELLDLRELDLPIYDPGRSLADYGRNVGRLVRAMRGADALLISGAAYHGTLAGISKNALDFGELLAGDAPPYLGGKVVGLIATRAGERAAPQTIAAMEHAVRALRGTVAPFAVPIGRAGDAAGEGGVIRDSVHASRLDDLGALVAEVARAGRREVAACV